MATDKVKAEIRRLKEEMWEKDRMTLGEAMNFCERAIRTPIDEVDETSDLAEKKTVRSVNTGDGPEVMDTKIEMFGKKDALHFLSKWHGWDAPKKVTHDVKFEVSQIVRLVRTPAKQQTINVS